MHSPNLPDIQERYEDDFEAILGIRVAFGASDIGGTCQENERVGKQGQAWKRGNRKGEEEEGGGKKMSHRRRIRRLCYFEGSIPGPVSRNRIRRGKGEEVAKREQRVRGI